MEFEQKIHPTALIHPKSKLHSSVKVGAYSVIGKSVEIKEGSEVGNFVTLTGNTVIGKNNKIYHYCSLGEAPQDKKFNNERQMLISKLLYDAKGKAIDKGVQEIMNFAHNKGLNK